MAWNNHLTNLRDVLCGLYFDKRDIARIAEQAGLDLAFLDFDGKIIVVWWNVLHEADKRQKVDEIVRIAVKENPENEILRLALREPLSDARGPDVDDDVDWKADEPVDAFEKIIGQQSTILPISFLELGLERSRCVARVVRQDEVSGSGFLVRRDLLITNHHVLEDEAQARGAKIQFNYQQTAAGLHHEPTEVDCQPEEGFLTSEEHDWTVVRLDGDQNARWGAIPLTPATVVKRARVIIVQHPGGGAKAIALYHNVVTFSDDNIVQYLTDTLPGSSGSPVFDSQWRIVALHHSGGWLREPGSKHKLFRNEGIAIGRLLAGARDLLEL